ncbi:MAG: hypothetical protein FJ291_12280 [Planctomycetes bacterium]|nr:hypothetical protein [Planctomycetota bacterium]
MLRFCVLAAALAGAVAACLVCTTTGPWAAEARGGQGLVPVKLDFPKAIPIPSPKNFRPNEHQEPPPPADARPPQLLAPDGATNIALKKPVTSSDDSPIHGEHAQLTDGDKRGTEDTVLELGPGRQWVQIDLKGKHNIHGVVVWHFRPALRYYHDVVVQVADDPDFIANVRTLFNSDYDNSSGLGIGKDREYMETHHGRVIPCKDIAAAYVRLYSRGSTENDMNHYVEVEVYGTPAR